MKATGMMLSMVTAIVVVVQTAAAATNFVITSYEGARSIVWDNTDTSLFYRVEWASDVTESNAWNANYLTLQDVRSSATSVTSPAPRFYRIAGYDLPMAPSSSWIRVGQTVDGVKGTFWEGDRFIFGGDTNTVIDTKTGLMWLRKVQVHSVATNWAEGLTFCADLVFGGYDDWRLPTYLELDGLTVFEDANNNYNFDNLNGDRAPFVEPNPSVSPFSWYWSSTETDSTHAMIVPIRRSGTPAQATKSETYWIMPVRNVTE